MSTPRLNLGSCHNLGIGVTEAREANQPMEPMEQPMAPGEDPRRRAFDFWLGEWEVRTASGELAGHSTISRVAGGCGLREEWRGARGLIGTSLNAWSAQTGHWHQAWVDSSGTHLQLEGELRDGAMVLEGWAPLSSDPGRHLRHRITWNLIEGDPDRVRQHWETSEDGATWETAFDGRYQRTDASDSTTGD
jgi:hypothetical protein